MREGSAYVDGNGKRKPGSEHLGSIPKRVYFLKYIFFPPWQLRTMAVNCFNDVTFDPCCPINQTGKMTQGNLRNQSKATRVELKLGKKLKRGLLCRRKRLGQTAQ